MAIWLNGREPPYMAADERTALNADMVKHAAMSLTYEASKIAAACFIQTYSSLGYTPAQICRIISGDNIQNLPDVIGKRERQ